jgi:hypothetical protein
VRRFAAPILFALAATLAVAPGAHAKLNLPKSADAPPVLPPGVVPADQAPVGSLTAQPRTLLSAAGKHFDLRSGPPPLWATVNICDTNASPNALGVRASVPGNGSRRRVYARFTAQWWSGAKQAWLTVGGRGKTDWVYIGTQGWNASQGGWTFHFSQPPAGTAYVIRGIVEMSWRQEARASRGKRKRAHWSQVDRRILLTETGKTGVRGGDPVGTSKAMCLIW